METVTNPRVTLKATYLEHTAHELQDHELLRFVIMKARCVDGNKEMIFKGVLEDPANTEELHNIKPGDNLILTLEIQPTKLFKQQDLDYAVNFKIEWVNALRLVAFRVLEAQKPAFKGYKEKTKTSEPRPIPKTKFHQDK